MKGFKKILLFLSLSFFILAAVIFAASFTGYRYNLVTNDIDRPEKSESKNIGSLAFTENGVFLAALPVSATFYPDLSFPLVYNPNKTVSKIDDPEKYDRISMGLRKHNIDGLVISGGDDTGSVVVDLSEHGIPCVHAPKTMDLDLQTYSVGGD